MVPIRIQTIMEQPFDVTKRAWRRMSVDGHREQGLLFQNKMVPRHFMGGVSAGIYGYKKRSAKYIRAKAAGSSRGWGAVKPGGRYRAIMGGKTDLVFSGRLMKLMMGFAAIRAVPSKVSIQHQLPEYAPPRPRTLRQPPIADEATRVNERDKSDLSRRLHHVILEGVNKYREPRTTDTG